MSTDVVFRWIARAEGVSLLLLMGVAMPLKYGWGFAEATLVPGWIHGGLFLAYVAALAWIGSEQMWSWSRSGLAFLAAWVPFGTMAFEAWLNRQAPLSGPPA